MAFPRLPASVRVIVRGWLNCNQVVLLGDAEQVLIDSGYSQHVGEALRLLAKPENHAGRNLDRVINTHCHSDHMGGNAALARRYQCRITIPAGEARQLRPWDPQALWMAYADQYAEPFEFHDTLSAGDEFAAGGLDWRALPAPGRDMDALMFWCAGEGVLISGDALWENGLGVVFPGATPNPHIEAALATLDKIAALKPRLVIPGHGTPFVDVVGALERARSRLEAFASDRVKNARHVVKVMFVFALLAKQRMRRDDLPAYLASVPCYRDLNRDYLALTVDQLAAWLVRDLEAAHAIQTRDGSIYPCMTA
jgi:glyoxylase-like metal-dependent hydrolase (beta-lactamase superfamily II)